MEVSLAIFFLVLNPKKQHELIIIFKKKKKNTVILSLLPQGADFYGLGLCPFIFYRDIDHDHWYKQTLNISLYWKQILSAGERKWITVEMPLTFIASLKKLLSWEQQDSSPLTHPTVGDTWQGTNSPSPPFHEQPIIYFHDKLSS